MNIYRTLRAALISNIANLAAEESYHTQQLTIIQMKKKESERSLSDVYKLENEWRKKLESNL